MRRLLKKLLFDNPYGLRLLVLVGIVIQPLLTLWEAREDLAAIYAMYWQALKTGRYPDAP